MEKKVRVLALYLPQFHPIKENNEWWGPGFTEWTNVAKAKPLYKGHYQPKIPADLSFYDLRLSETREAQAELAKEAGVEGFAYWHYWFEGRRLIERPFDEVLKSGKPDYPFCLFWANHSWYAKTWDKNIPNKLLIKQTYPGIEDYVNHFNYCLQAFKDHRYIKKGNKPVFGIYSAQSIPNIELMKETWNKLARENGFDGIYFMSYSFNIENYKACKALGLDYDFLDIMDNATGLAAKWRENLDWICGKLHIKRYYSLKLVDYSKYIDVATEYYKNDPESGICILPNYDHSPRSGKRAPILVNSTPENFERMLDSMNNILQDREGDEEFLLIKAWNEWGEGNYLEPDIKYGHGYLDAIKHSFKK